MKVPRKRCALTIKVRREREKPAAKEEIRRQADTTTTPKACSIILIHNRTRETFPCYPYTTSTSFPTISSVPQ